MLAAMRLRHGAREVDGMRPQPDMAKFGEGVMECLGENQRRIAKFFEDEMSAVVGAAAPVLKPLLASTAGKLAGKDERKTAEAAAPTSANIEVGYSDVFVGRVPRSLANSELQRFFDTEAIPVRYHGNGKHGFAKLLVRKSEIDRALNLDSAVFGHKFRVAKWKQRASEGPGPSLQSHAQGRQSRGQRYSNVASEKTAELRMNSALRDMRWLLNRLKPPSNLRGRPAFW